MRRLFLTGLMSAVAPVYAASTSVDVTQARAITEQKIVEIKGMELPTLTHKNFSTFTLFAVRQGLLVPIPHQCEDFDDEGYSWFKQGKVKLRGSEGVFDSHDSMFFRFSDAGTRVTAAQAGQNMTEIRIQDGSEVRYVYVSQQGMGFSYNPLAQYNPKTGLISTDFFTLQTDPDNLLQWSDFTYKNFQGLPNNTLLDTLKVRVDAGVFLTNARASLDNQDLRTKVVAVKAGPVRTVMLAQSSMNFAGVPVVFLDLQMQLYPQQINIDAKVEVPAILKRLLKEPTATVSLDGHNLTGSEIRSSVAKQTVVVDGKMTPEESSLGTNPIQQNGWFWLSSHKGFDFFTTLYIPPNFNVPVTLHYQDSMADEDDPERFVGQGPNIGYHMRDIPVNDTFHFAFQAYFTDALAGNTPPEQLGANLARVPTISSSSLEPGGLELVQHQP